MKKFELLIAVITAVATVAAAFAAASAATSARNSAVAAQQLNEQSLAEMRPYLSIESITFHQIDPIEANLTVIVKNVGSRAATNVTSRVTELRPLSPGEAGAGGAIGYGGRMYTAISDYGGALANDLAPSQARGLFPATVRTNPNATFVVLSMAYEDPGLHARPPAQRFFYHLSNGEIEEASRAEREAIEPYFAGINMDNSPGRVGTN